MWFVCGLGNPGKKYKNTRHNIGFDILDKLIHQYDLEIFKKDKTKELFKGKIDNKKVTLCKTLSYMNCSGEVIKDIIKFYKIPITKILIIHDDIDLKLGKIKIKIGGSNGGHNGLLNIDNNIGKEYKRLRIGVGHPGEKNQVNSYVLEKFNKDEEKIIENLITFISSEFSLVFEKENNFLTKLSLINKKT
tara:strand:- start:240 stop:809 length:570 start_codon:yes stop_codon:yes gene_type:complete